MSSIFVTFMLRQRRRNPRLNLIFSGTEEIYLTSFGGQKFCLVLNSFPFPVFEGFSSSGLSWLYFVLRLWLRNKTDFLFVTLHSYNLSKKRVPTGLLDYYLF